MFPQKIHFEKLNIRKLISELLSLSIILLTCRLITD